MFKIVLGFGVQNNTGAIQIRSQMNGRLVSVPPRFFVSAKL